MELGRRSVNHVVASYIEALLLILGQFTGRKLSGRYCLDDNQWESSLSSSSANSLPQCFADAHYVRYEYLKEFYELVFNANDARGSSSTNLTALDLVLDVVLENQRLLEAGGGMGSGFQLYCDDEMLISTGGGGGGGASKEGKMLSFGSGGGGGIQISKALSKYLAGHSKSIAYHEKSSRYYSLGGGGGCGSCTATSAASLLQENNPASEQSVRNVYALCGSSVDADAVTLSAVRDILGNPRMPDFIDKRCQQVQVLGGGGGGGGVVFRDPEANADADTPSIGAGYGFSFELIGDTAASTHDASAPLQRVSQDELPAVWQSAEPSSTQDDNSIGRSAFLEGVAQACGGYSKWPCICAEALQRVRACANSTDTASEGVAAGASLGGRDCSAVRALGPSFAAMLQGSCTHGSFRSGNTSNLNDIDDLALCPTDTVVVGTKQYGNAGNDTLRVTYLHRSAADSEGGGESTSFAALLGGLTVLPNALASQTLLLSSALAPVGEASGYSPPTAVIVCLLLVVSSSLLCAARYCTEAYSAKDRNKYVALP